MRVLVIGMGNFGVMVAKYLQESKNEVCIIDKDMSAVENNKDYFENTFRLDAIQINALKELSPQEFDVCIVTVGDDFQSCLEITANLKELGAKKIITKCYDDVQDKFLIMAGADEIVYPEKESAAKLATTLSNNHLLDYMRIGNNLGIFEIVVPKKWMGKSLIELKLREKFNINVLAIKKNANVITVTPDYVFEKGDAMYAFTDEKTVAKVTKLM